MFPIAMEREWKWKMNGDGSYYTPCEDSAFEHEGCLAVGEDGDEQLVHVDGLHQHPAHGREQEIVNDDAQAGAPFSVGIDVVDAGGAGHPHVRR